MVWKAAILVIAILSIFFAWLAWPKQTGDRSN